MTKIKEVIEKNKSPESIRDITGYTFKSRRKNPEWSSEKLIPLRFYHIHNNARLEEAMSFLIEKASLPEAQVFISTIPKYLTVLNKPVNLDTGTGEIIYDDYNTDDFKASRQRKIKTVNKFSDKYDPLYHKQIVSLLFFTFTRTNFAKKDMRRMMDIIKDHLIAENRPILGYIRVQEIKPNEKIEGGWHVHEHIVVAIKRVKWKTIPERLKFNDIWGQRTGVEFVRKGVKCYLSKYLYKSDAKLLGKRSYAISRKLL